MSNFSRLSALFALLVSLVGGAVTYTPASAASIRFVKPAGASSGSCTTWATACTLQWAISISLVGDQIWVQAGTYIPHPSDRTVSFRLKNELPIYGGFNGTETQLAQRNPAANVTILSGDLRGNDGPNFTNNGENSYHVVTTSHANSATILDGFTIRGGNANVGPWDDATGGGMRNTNGSNPTLRNLTFSRNFATIHGGGMFNSQSNPSLTNVTFADNSAGKGGGGMYNDLANNPTLTNVRFLRNKADTGGGMTNYSSSPVLMDVIFSENSATYGGGMNNYLVDNPIDNPKLTSVTFDRNSATSGGGLYNKGDIATLTDVQFLGNIATYDGGGMINENSSPSLTNVTFSENSAKAGGGMLNFNNSNPQLINATFGGNSAEVGGGMYNNASSPELTDVTFRGNFASGSGGGGMYNLEGSNPALTNVTFDMNSTNSWGGGMFNKNSSPSLTNVTFSSNRTINSSNSWGGGMFNEDSSPRLTNVTFSGNEAAEGGGIYSFNNPNNNSQLTLTNTIIANSLRGGDCFNPSTTLDPASSNNLIEDPSRTCGLSNGENGNIIGVDPRLGPLANNGGPTQTHALLAGSPAIDAGTDPNCPATDQRGVTRPLGSHCDIGAYELPIFRTISGNAGAAGVTMKYIDGTPKAVVSQPNGNYSLTVPWGWSGTVTPASSCFAFNPLSRTYNNLSTNQTTQNYSAIFDSASGCAKVDVKFGPTLQGTYGVPKNGGARLSSPVDSGPIFLNGTNGVPFIASERVLFPNNGLNTVFFSEMMGLPVNLKSSTYAFPAYDNVNFDSQLRFANLGNVATQVSVTVAGVPVQGSPFNLPAGASSRKSFPGVNNGPVIIQSSGGVPIIAALRILTRPYNGSFSEIMGLPASQWGSSYIFPWYNNQELDSQLRIANVGSSTTAVKVMIGQQDITSSCTSSPNHSFNLGARASIRVICNVSNGPLKVISTSTVPIVASLRVAFKTGSTWTSFSEMMGLPETQLAAGYVFPWYNNKELNTQLRVANPNLSNSTSVRVLIGGQEMAGSPFPLAGGQSLRKSFAGISGGPVVVRSTNGVKIIASLRVLFPQTGTRVTSFSELMGLPETQMVTGYLFPWYNNLALNTQLRLGVP